MPSSKNYLAIFGLLFGAVCWGVIWYPYRLLQEAGIFGVASSFYTYSVAVALGSVLFLRDWRGMFNQPKIVFLLALCAGWTNLSYVLAVIDGEVMRVMLLFYLSPLWTLILAHYWLKERIELHGVVTIAISLLGAFIMLTNVFANKRSWLPVPQNNAEWLAFSAGVGFACTNVISRKSIHLSVATKSMSVWLGAVFVALMLMLIQTASMPMPTTLDLMTWGVILVIAVILIAATLFVQYGVTKITATRASVIFLFELVVAAIASYYFANEVMEPHEWLGGFLIVAAALYAAWSDDKAKQSAH
jgi:drug/metabolite transporter (DMT)-like permease